MPTHPLPPTRPAETRSGKRWRVAFLNTHPIQYFAPLYADLNRSADFDITALYLSDISIRGDKDPGFARPVQWDIDLLQGYEALFVDDRAKSRRPGSFFSLVAPALWNIIRRRRFDALVIHGHNYCAHHIALAAARSCGTRVFMRGESHLGLARPGWKTALRTPILKALYRNLDGVLAIGSANRAHYRRMGVPDNRIHLLPYAVDNDRFAAFGTSDETERAAKKVRLGLRPTSPAILFAAKFQKRKRAADLVHAVRILQEKHGIDCQLVLVGTGEHETELRNLVDGLGLQAATFHGFKNQSELPLYYAACDVFVLPSDNEPWGLAVNEAMAAAMPVVVSEEVGCAADLIEPGINGATFPAGDISALADALHPLLADPDFRSRAAKASQNRISRWSYRECAEGLRSALLATERDHFPAPVKLAADLRS